ncbi:MAG: response regulator transcription factor [Magnetospirillum sp. WYHS-4]
MESCSVIVVEGEAMLRDGLVEGLRREGIAAAGSGDTLGFYRSLTGKAFDVAVVDLELPEQEGYEIVHHLRSTTDMGIVVLTVGEDPMNRIRGYQAGADLCFVKPMMARELAAVVNNMVSRIHRRPTVDGTANWRYDPVYWVLKAPGGTSIRLTPKEKTLLDLLVGNSGRTVTRSQILGALEYGDGSLGNRNLDTLMRRLRRKVQETAGEELPVQTVHAVGYVFTAQVSAR